MTLRVLDTYNIVLRLRHKDEGGRTIFKGVTHLGVLKDGETEVVSAGQVRELHVGFGAGGQFAAEFDRPDAVLPIPGGGDVTAVTDDGGLDNAGDVGTNRHGVESSLVEGDLFAIE